MSLTTVPLSEHNFVVGYIAGIENVTKRLLSPLAEQLFSLENIGSSVKVIFLGGGGWEEGEEEEKEE